MMAVLTSLTGHETINLAGGDQINVATLSSLSLPSHLGTFVCNGVTGVTVADANVTANSAIIITLKTVGGTVGAVPAVKTITPTTGFTVAGTASDTSTYNYNILG
jgi:hypothetical protein